MKVSIGCRLGSASPPHPSPSEKIWGQGKRALWTKRLHWSPVVVVERSTKLPSVKIHIGSSLVGTNLGAFLLDGVTGKRFLQLTREAGFPYPKIPQKFPKRSIKEE